MRDTLKARNFLWLAGLVLLVAVVGLVVLQPGAQAASVPKDQDQLDLIVELGKGLTVESVVTAVSNIGSSGQDGVRFFTVDSFFDVFFVSNIGSSGEDGVRFIAPPSFDSFFDIEYSVASPVDSSFPTEMVALSLGVTLDDPDNPAAVLDAVKGAVTEAGSTVLYHRHRGHVTILK